MVQFVRVGSRYVRLDRITMILVTRELDNPSGPAVDVFYEKSASPTKYAGDDARTIIEAAEATAPKTFTVEYSARPMPTRLDGFRLPKLTTHDETDDD
jgi:hypothetical protein